MPALDMTKNETYAAILLAVVVVIMLVLYYMEGELVDPTPVTLTPNSGDQVLKESMAHNKGADAKGQQQCQGGRGGTEGFRGSCEGLSTRFNLGSRDHYPGFEYNLPEYMETLDMGLG